MQIVQNYDKTVNGFLAPNPNNIPAAIRNSGQLVCWGFGERFKGSGPTKIPITPTGRWASSTDAETWSSFDSAWRRYLRGGLDGIGYVLAKHDLMIGIDLDGCRNPATGQIAEWAMAEIRRLNTYAEISPSGTGVKAWCGGTLAGTPLEGVTGGKIELPYEPMGGKAAGLEVYSHGRYFAVTGHTLECSTANPQPRQEQIDALVKKHFKPKPVVTRPRSVVPCNQTEAQVAARARRYVDTMPAAVSGQGGHGQTFHVACVVANGFDLRYEQAWPILVDYSQRCEPPWSDHELRHKLNGAYEAGGKKGYLRDSERDRGDNAQVEWVNQPWPEQGKGAARRSISIENSNRDTPTRAVRRLRALQAEADKAEESAEHLANETVQADFDEKQWLTADIERPHVVSKRSRCRRIRVHQQRCDDPKAQRFLEAPCHSHQCDLCRPNWLTTRKQWFCGIVPQWPAIHRTVASVDAIKRLYQQLYRRMKKEGAGYYVKIPMADGQVLLLSSMPTTESQKVEADDACQSIEYALEDIPSGGRVSCTRSIAFKLAKPEGKNEWEQVEGQAPLTRATGEQVRQGLRKLGIRFSQVEFIRSNVTVLEFRPSVDRETLYSVCVPGYDPPPPFDPDDWEIDWEAPSLVESEQ